MEAGSAPRLERSAPCARSDFPLEFLARASFNGPLRFLAIPMQSRPSRLRQLIHHFAPQTANEGGVAPIDIHTAQVAGINVMPSGGGEPPQVELQMRVTAALPRAGHRQ